MPRRSRLTPAQREAKLLARAQHDRERPDLVVRREKEHERKRRRLRGVDEARVHLRGCPPKPDMPEDIAKSFIEAERGRRKFREASIAGCNELLRLLKLHHGVREGLQNRSVKWTIGQP
jgi:hypothetical protein